MRLGSRRGDTVPRYRTIRDIDARGKKVLVRVDFNVPLTPAGAIADDWRIEAALPTIQYLLGLPAAVVLASHLGRPKGDAEADRRLRMDAVAQRLGERLGQPVQKADDVVGDDARRKAAALEPGQVLLLENLRFHPGEKAGDESFARQLAALADIYCNDAFGTCHRRDASMVAVPLAFPEGARVVGLLLERELRALEELTGEPKRPYVAVMGGAKVSDKVRVMRALLQRVDRLLVGGAMVYTLRLARGLKVGSSLVELDWIDEARRLLRDAGEKLVLAVDHVVAERPEAGAATQIVESDFPEGWYGVDIGPATRARFGEIIRGAGTAVWNGPMGKFEDEPFRAGTEAVARAMAECRGVTVVGGGETAEAVRMFGLADRISHVSTGGGAFLKYLEGSTLPALEVLDVS